MYLRDTRSLHGEVFPWGPRGGDSYIKPTRGAKDTGKGIVLQEDLPKA